MDTVAELERARDSHRRHAWADACEVFWAVDRVAALGVGDLERLGEAVQMLGRGDETVRVLQRQYRAHVDAGEIGNALRCAFWLSQALVMKGEFAHAGGWNVRAGRLAETGPQRAERGYLLILQAEGQAGEGDHAGAYATAAGAVVLGVRCADQDLVTVAGHIQGRARIKQGRIEEGLALLDEAMVSITAGETSPRVTGWIYCSVIDACREVHEVRRAQEWTRALNAWCDARPQFTGGYSGVCRIHRAELLQHDGAWPQAIREARLACEQLTQGFGEILAGMAFYQLGEIHRLRGESLDATQAYRRASQYGWQTQPGLALLRLAQGKVDTAVDAIRRVLAETTDRLARSQLLPAYVEIMLATGDVAAARDAAAELTEIAEANPTPALQARSAHARGCVHLAGGSPETALPALRHAWRLWSDLDAPYEAARARTLIGMACHALHDEDTAAMEFDAARGVFAQLGAVPDVSRIDALTGKRPIGDAAGLSAREVEVLRLIATGKSNREIAAALRISSHTVARHLQNIFAKLGVTSRAAATAFAFEHHLI